MSESEIKNQKSKMPLDIYDELHNLLGALQGDGVSYALCGGLAVAVYGIVRATEDIDLLIEEASLGKVRAVAEGLGFRFGPKPLVFKRGRIKIYRLVKIAGEDLLKLDLLLVTPSTQLAWDSRRTMRTELGRLQVVSPAGLIHLKSLRRSGQDEDDIRKLKELPDET